MKNFTITITRQFGSLGRPIAQKLSTILGCEYYDRDIVEAAAKELNIPLSVVGKEEEKAKSKWFDMKYPLGINTTKSQDDIFNIQQKVISELAQKKSAIFVGRCSDFILRDQPNLLRISIYAPYEKRLQNCIEVLNLEETEAKKMISDVDKARDKYHKTYAGYLPFDYKHNELMIDSSLLGVEGTAEYIADLVRRLNN